MEFEQFEKLVKEEAHKLKHNKSDPDVISIIFSVRDNRIFTSLFKKFGLRSVLCVLVQRSNDWSTYSMERLNHKKLCR